MKIQIIEIWGVPDYLESESPEKLRKAIQETVSRMDGFNCREDDIAIRFPTELCPPEKIINARIYVFKYPELVEQVRLDLCTEISKKINSFYPSEDGYTIKVYLIELESRGNTAEIRPPLKMRR